MKPLENYTAYDIPCDQIYADRSFNCRSAFTLQSVEELAASIKGQGLQFPVVVQPTKGLEGCFRGRQYRLVAGHRRFEAVSKILKWPKIPAMVKEGLTEKEARTLNFLENLERRDLNLVDQAKWIANTYPPKTPLRTIAKDLKRDTRWVHARLRLARLPEEIQNYVADGRLKLLDVESLSKYPPDEQLYVAKKMLERKEKKQKVDDLRIGRRFRNVKTKAQMRAMITHLFDSGVQGLPTRLLAWAAGWVSDEEIHAEISTSRGSNGVVTYGDLNDHEKASDEKDVSG